MLNENKEFVRLKGFIALGALVLVYVGYRKSGRFHYDHNWHIYLIIGLTLFAVLMLMKYFGGKK